MAKRVNTNVTPYRPYSQTKKNQNKTLRRQVTTVSTSQKNKARLGRGDAAPEGSIKVKSSNLKSVSYDKESKDLTIVFNRNNRTYVYHGVPYGIYFGLLNAPSKGTYFFRFIANRYTYAETTKSAIKGKNPKQRSKK